MTALLLLFEDEHAADLGPLSDAVPVPGLAFGGSDVATRWLHALPELRLLGLECRPRQLAAWAGAPAPAATRPGSGDEVLAVNAAALPGAWLGSALAGGWPALWTSGDRLVAARLSFGVLAPGLGRGPALEGFLRALDLPRTEVPAQVLRWPWDLVEANLEALAADLDRLEPTSDGEISPLAAVLEPSRVRVERGSRVDPYAVLDARSGPIHLGARVVVGPHTVVQGPCVVGEGTELLGGLVGRSTIGPGCRIAGEVDATVWQGWSNKRHHGFVGHSAIGEWVNLGALTTTSDLKNNYGEVRVWAAGAERATGLAKVGSLVGAHVKTGIGTLLPTGASLGVGAVLFGGGRFTPKRVAPFGWWDGERTLEHRFDRFLETARTAMGRRGRRLAAADEALLGELFESSRDERGAAGARSDPALTVREGRP